MILKQADPQAISVAIYSLASGGIVISPTETCYGMLADAADAKAVGKIYGLKERGKLKSISIFVSDEKMASDFATIGKAARKLIKKYLPGPLTLILRKRRPFKLAKNLSKGGTAAIRISSHPFIRALLRNYGRPLTATSANISGKGEIYDGMAAERTFGKEVGVIINGGRLKRNPPTTIVDCSGKGLRILRQGSLRIKA